MHNEREKIVEALLFESGEGYSVSRLAEILDCDEDEVEETLSDLAHSLKAANRGIRLLRKDGRAVLATSGDVSEVLQRVRKEALSGPLSAAALETLTVVLYLGPIRKGEIDYIRGVNSQGILRSLCARGLVEQVNENGVIHYTGTLKLLRFLGVEKSNELEDHEKVRASFEETLKGGDKEGDE